MTWRPQIGPSFLNAYQSDAQREAVVEFTVGQIIRHEGRDARIFAYSIDASVEGLRRDMSNNLLREISERHEKKSEEIIAHKTRSLISSYREYPQVSEKAAVATEMARLELEEALRREQPELGAARREMAFRAGPQIRVRTEAGEKFRAHAPELDRHLESVTQSVLRRIARALQDRMAARFELAGQWATP